jgi:FtsZ-interacting cell division protein ZipA
VHAALLVALSLTALWTVRRERRRHKLDRNLN